MIIKSGLLVQKELVKSHIGKITYKGRHFILSEKYRLPNNAVANTLLVDTKGNLWIAGETGLFTMTDAGIKPFEIIVSDKKIKSIDINDICELHNGDFVMGTENNGLIFLNTQTHKGRIFKYNKNSTKTLINDRVRTVLEDDRGYIWIGTRYGLSIYNPKTNKFRNFSQNIIHPRSLSHNSVRDIFQDNSGGIWIATYSGGVNYYHPWNNLFNQVKEEYGIKNTLSYNKVSYLYKDNLDILWIGTEGRGLNSLNESSGLFKHYSIFKDHYVALDNIKSISKGQGNLLWIGTNGGLIKFNKKTKSLKTFIHNPSDSASLSYNQIHTTLVDRYGQLWIGTNGGGLNLYLPQSNSFKAFRKSNDSQSLISNNINHIIEDNEGLIWIGTESGIDRIDPVSMKFVRNNSTEKMKSILPPFRIIVLFEDSENYLWIGTEGNGIICLNKYNNTIERYNLESGLPDNVINSIEEDNSNNIWISTNKGISKLTLNRDSSRIKLIKVKNFNKTDGLQSNQFSYRSSFKDKLGKMYFGGIEGYNTFYPDQIKDTVLTPRVIFTNLRVNYKTVNTNDIDSPIKKSISETNNIVIKHFQKQIALTFTSLSYINPDNIYYSYMLEGLDNNWINIGKQRTISFSQLRTGSYKLRVRASDNPSVWRNQESTINITVLPPPWKTWWAYTAYSLIVLIVLGSILFYINKWLLLKNKLALEKHTKEKEKELYQKKVRFFTDVSHELRTPLTLILGPLEKLISDVKLNYKLEKQLEIVLHSLHSARKMHSLINQLLNLRKFEKGYVKLQASKGNISRFVKEMTLPFREMAKLKKINFEFLTEIESIEAWYDRPKMEIALYNLFSNAIKATPPQGNIKVTIELVNDKAGDKLPATFVKITISDDGKGISPEHIDKIFDRFYQPDNQNTGDNMGTGIGLELAMRMIKLHGGLIEVSSKLAEKANNGWTTFTVLIPLGKDHLKPSDIREEYTTSEDSSLYKVDLLSTEILKDEDYDIDLSFNGNKEKPLMMVVEDNIEVCMFIKSLFISNYRVKTAHDGKSGLEKVQKFMPDIIISDIMMPEMDGIELCRLVKTDVRICHIPVILLTARTELAFKYEGLETGADDYIQKPFSARYLAMKVKNLIEQRRLIHEHFYRNSIVKPEELALTSIDENLIRKAVSYIEKNINNPDLSVDSLSKELALSRVHLYRKIKSLTNLTAVEFIRNIRLKKAAQLFEAGKYNVEEVRFLVGFNDAHYFRTSFKKQFGLNPKDFINKFSR